MNNNMVSYKDLIVFHPGSYVEEILEDLNMTQKEFAERLGVSAKTISKIVNAEESISKDTANKLAKMTGISVQTWINLQNTYDLKLLEIQNKKIEDEKKICDMIDFSYLKTYGFIDNRRYSIEEKIEELRKLLKVSDLTYLLNFNTNVSYRNTKGFEEKSIVNSNVMLELATNLARNYSNNKLDIKKLQESLHLLRELTTQDSKDFFPRLREILLDCGIVLIGLPKLKNAGLNGATKRFKNGSVLLLITDKNKSSDVFWFFLFHEIGHILNKDFYSDYSEESYSRKEKIADCFAKDILIPDLEFNEFISRSQFDLDNIVHFSRKINIHPSILVGRLQWEKLIEYSEFNQLKVSYTFTK